ncbi:hypothetical protein [Arthrobacter sp. A5]|uniref:hypothetical protein n=1 Tax=Arthrobacter sp. A5 TaxID=576926 RepID=UPI003DA85023
MSAVEDLLAHAEDQPAIGLLLCKSTNNVVAEYALRGFSALFKCEGMRRLISLGLRGGSSPCLRELLSAPSIQRSATVDSLELACG